MLILFSSKITKNKYWNNPGVREITSRKTFRQEMTLSKKHNVSPFSTPKGIGRQMGISGLLQN